MTAPARVALAAVMVLYLGLLPVILTNYDMGRAYSDQHRFYYPTILRFKEGLGVRDYPSAMTPGYHMVMAGFARLHDSEVFLKVISSCFTALLIAILALLLGQRLRPLHALGVMLPA